MDSYTIMHYVPYEGQSSVFEGTLSECKQWLKDNVVNPSNSRLYGYDINDLELYNNDAPDINDLYRQ